MQMGPKEIAVEYRTAANKQKQIKVLAELNQCAERRIAEILAAEGEELPKKYEAILKKPARRSWKYPEGEPKAAPAEKAEPEPVEVAVEPDPGAPAAPATDRDLFDAVASLLPEAAARVSLQNAEEARAWVDGVGPAPVEPDCRADAAPTVREVRRVEVPRSIPTEALLRTACRLMTSALALSPDDYHTYSCGVLDLVHALTEE